MPTRTHKPPAKKQNALTEIAKQINLFKVEFSETDREEKIEAMLIEVRKLWRDAWNCDDAVKLDATVKQLNYNRYLINRQFILSRQYTHNGYEFVVSVERI